MSTGLECMFFELSEGQWYYTLENWSSPKGAFDWTEDSQTFGPFGSEDAAIIHLSENHANPGGWSSYPLGAISNKARYEALAAKATRPSPNRRTHR